MTCTATTAPEGELPAEREPLCCNELCWGPGGSLHMHMLLALLAAASMNDNQIANVALTANQIDIDRGKLALKHTKNDQVKQFAEQMIQDHGASNAEAKALAGRLGVKPEPSDTSTSIQAGAKKAAARLKKEKGARFDKDYIDTEVAYHQAVIDAVKNTLAPGAQNPELKKLLENAVPTFEGHLQHAKMVQSQLGPAASK